MRLFEHSSLATLDQSVFITAPFAGKRPDKTRAFKTSSNDASSPSAAVAASSLSPAAAIIGVSALDR